MCTNCSRFFNTIYKNLTSFFLVIILACWSYGSFAQTEEWSTLYSAGGYQFVESIEPFSNGYLISGSTDTADNVFSSNSGRFDVWFAHINSSGAVVWDKSLGGIGNDVVAQVLETPSNKFMVAASSDSAHQDVSGNNGGFDFWLAWLDSNRNIIWENNFGGSKDDNARDMVRTPQGNFIIVGTSASSDGDVTANQGEKDLWIMKVDSTGTMMWQKSYGGPGHERVFDVCVTSDNKYLIAGESDASGADISNNYGGRDAWVVKLNTDGSLAWEKNYGGSKQDVALGIHRSNGGYMVNGATMSVDEDLSNNKGDFDAWVFKLDGEGKMLWSRNHGGSQRDVYSDLAHDPDGGLVLSGYTYSNDGDITGDPKSGDYWVAKLNDQGEMQWNHLYGGQYSNRVKSMHAAHNGGYVFAGEVHPLTSQPSLGRSSIEVFEICSPTYKHVQRTLCENNKVYVANEPYGAEGRYYDTLTNKAGCDSVLIIDIERIDAKVNLSGNTLYSSQRKGSFQWLRCDSGYSEINGATSASYTPDSTGQFALRISKDGCSDVSRCFYMTASGIVQNSFGKALEVYPNPVSKQVNVQLGETYHDVQARLRDISGKLHKTIDAGTTNALQMNIEGDPGVYILLIETRGGKKARIRILKK